MTPSVLLEEPHVSVQPQARDSEPHVAFTLRPIMRQGIASSIPETWTRFSTLDDARRAVKPMYQTIACSASSSSQTRRRRALSNGSSDNKTDAKRPARVLPLLYLGTAHVSLASRPCCRVLATSGGRILLSRLADWPRASRHARLDQLLDSRRDVHRRSTGAPHGHAAAAPGLRRLRVCACRSHRDGGPFLDEQYTGMAWSAATIASSMFYMTVRIIASVRGAKIHRSVKLHIVLACLNFWLAAAMGLLIGFDKVCTSCQASCSRTCSPMPTLPRSGGRR